MAQVFDKVKPDWISFTFKNIYKKSAFLKRLISAGSPVYYQDFGRFGYDSSAKFVNGGVVYWSEVRPDMGVHVVVPAKCIHWFGWLFWVKAIKDFGGKVKRFDLAVDTVNFSIDELLERFKDGHVTMRYRQNSLIVGDVLSPIRTWYFGSRTSDSFLRIYEKGKKEELGDFLRVEFEFKRNVAHKLFEMFVSGEPVVNILLGYIAFRDGDASRATRSSVWKKWASVFGTHFNWLRLLDKRDVTFEKQIEWLKRQVSKVLVTVIDKSPDAFADICDVGYTKLGL